MNATMLRRGISMWFYSAVFTALIIRIYAVVLYCFWSLLNCVIDHVLVGIVFALQPVLAPHLCLCRVHYCVCR